MRTTRTLAGLNAFLNCTGVMLAVGVGVLLRVLLPVWLFEDVVLGVADCDAVTEEVGVKLLVGVTVALTDAV